jgi:hypothetical protein
MMGITSAAVQRCGSCLVTERKGGQLVNQCRIKTNKKQGMTGRFFGR